MHTRTTNSKSKLTVLHHHLPSIMTYQKQSQTHDDETSSLLTSVPAAPAPPFSFGQGGGGVTTTKKTNGVPMRAMIATCVLLGTLAVIYYGGTGASSNTHRRVGTPSLPSSASSLSSLRTAALEDSPEDKVVDGGFQCYPHGDVCYAGNPFLSNGGCCATASCVREKLGFGCVCIADPTTAPSLPPTQPPTNPPTNDPNKYDPSHDWCFKDNDNDGKYCWFPTHNYPCGNWGGWDAAYDNCGPKCTTVYWYEDKYSCDYL